jgi:hypothetical protein
MMQGMSDFTIIDEAFMKMTWAPSGVHALATVLMPGGQKKGDSLMSVVIEPRGRGGDLQ